MFYKMEEEILNEECITYDQMMILIDFQKLWFKIAVWVRIYIRAAIYNTPNKEAVTDYLLEIPNEAYSIFTRYYSSKEADTIKELLTAFIEAIMETIEAMRYGNEVLINSKISKLYQSANKMSSYLASINEYWDEEEWQNLFYKYISIKIDEVNAVINDDYEEEIRLYNMVEDVNYSMAEYMAEGIIYLINKEAQNNSVIKKIL